MFTMCLRKITAYRNVNDIVFGCVTSHKTADGIIYENMKFCEFWSYEKVLANHIFTNEKHIPCCTIEKEYSLGAVGQLRTRFQAFIESLEIKSIQGGK